MWLYFFGKGPSSTVQGPSNRQKLKYTFTVRHRDPKYFGSSCNLGPTQLPLNPHLRNGFCKNRFMSPIKISTKIFCFSVQVHGPRAMCSKSPCFLHFHLCQIYQNRSKNVASLGRGQHSRKMLKVPETNQIQRYCWPALPLVSPYGKSLLN